MDADSKSAPPADPRTWAFWRKRLGRALIVGALGLTAAQILPALPEDQLVRLEPPAGVRLTRAKLTYFSKEDGEAILGTELVPVEPAPQLTHALRLPRGDYLVTVIASGADAESAEQSYTVTRTITLSGATTRVFLRPSKSAP